MSNECPKDGTRCEDPRCGDTSPCLLVEFPTARRGVDPEWRWDRPPRGGSRV